jgi:hypothetical protein
MVDDPNPIYSQEIPFVNLTALHIPNGASFELDLQ